LVVFGRRAVAEALASTKSVEVEGVRIAKGSPKKSRDEISALCKERGVSCDVVDGLRVTEWSRDQRNDQGVAARIRLTRVQSVEAFAGSIHGKRAATPTRLVAVDGITNPQNLGMIIRSALGCGFDGILWPMEGSPWVSGLIIKGSAGTVYRTDLITCPTLADGIYALREKGFKAFGLDMAGGETLKDHTPAHRAVYIVGSETTGISQPVREAINGIISIPLQGQVESLNAAVAAGVLCFHIASTPSAEAN
jgi:23S rRNA (guanosine2251-2'-O)-methyltransferase